MDRKEQHLVCVFCQARFSVGEELLEHIRIHTGNFPEIDLCQSDDDDDVEKDEEKKETDSRKVDESIDGTTEVQYSKEVGFMVDSIVYDDNGNQISRSDGNFFKTSNRNHKFDYDVQSNTRVDQPESLQGFISSAMGNQSECLPHNANIESSIYKQQMDYQEHSTSDNTLQSTMAVGQSSLSQAMLVDSDIYQESMEHLPIDTTNDELSSSRDETGKLTMRGVKRQLLAQFDSAPPPLQQEPDDTLPKIVSIQGNAKEWREHDTDANRVPLWPESGFPADLEPQCTSDPTTEFTSDGKSMESRSKADLPTFPSRKDLPILTPSIKQVASVSPFTQGIPPMTNIVTPVLSAQPIGGLPTLTPSFGALTTVSQAIDGSLPVVSEYISSSQIVSQPNIGATVLQPSTNSVTASQTSSNVPISQPNDRSPIDEILVPTLNESSPLLEDFTHQPISSNYNERSMEMLSHVGNLDSQLISQPQPSAKDLVQSNSHIPDDPETSSVRDQANFNSRDVFKPKRSLYDDKNNGLECENSPPASVDDRRSEGHKPLQHHANSLEYNALTPATMGEFKSCAGVIQQGVKRQRVDCNIEERTQTVHLEEECMQQDGILGQHSSLKNSFISEHQKVVERLNDQITQERCDDLKRQTVECNKNLKKHSVIPDLVGKQKQIDQRSNVKISKSEPHSIQLPKRDKQEQPEGDKKLKITKLKMKVGTCHYECPACRQGFRRILDQMNHKCKGKSKVQPFNLNSAYSRLKMFKCLHCCDEFSTIQEKKEHRCKRNGVGKKRNDSTSSKADVSGKKDTPSGKRKKGQSSSKEVPEGWKKYKCQKCGEGFLREAWMRAHMAFCLFPEKKDADLAITPDFDKGSKDDPSAVPGSVLLKNDAEPVVQNVNSEEVHDEQQGIVASNKQVHPNKPVLLKKIPQEGRVDNMQCKACCTLFKKKWSLERHLRKRRRCNAAYSVTDMLQLAELSARSADESDDGDQSTQENCKGFGKTMHGSVPNESAESCNSRDCNSIEKGESKENGVLIREPPPEKDLLDIGKITPTAGTDMNESKISDADLRCPFCEASKRTFQSVDFLSLHAKYAHNKTVSKLSASYLYFVDTVKPTISLEDSNVQDGELAAVKPTISSKDRNLLSGESGGDKVKKNCFQIRKCQLCKDDIHIFISTSSYFSHLKSKHGLMDVDTSTLPQSKQSRKCHKSFEQLKTKAVSTSAVSSNDQSRSSTALSVNKPNRMFHKSFEELKATAAYKSTLHSYRQIGSCHTSFEQMVDKVAGTSADSSHDQSASPAADSNNERKGACHTSFEQMIDKVASVSAISSNDESGSSTAVSTNEQKGPYHKHDKSFEQLRVTKRALNMDPKDHRPTENCEVTNCGPKALKVNDLKVQGVTQDIAHDKNKQTEDTSTRQIGPEVCDRNPMYKSVQGISSSSDSSDAVSDIPNMISSKEQAKEGHPVASKVHTADLPDRGGDFVFEKKAVKSSDDGQVRGNDVENMKEQVDRGTYHCCHCNFQSHSYSGMQRHLMVSHNIRRPVMVKTSMAENVFRAGLKLSGLEKFITVQRNTSPVFHKSAKGFTCSVCEKSFRRRRHIKSHVRKHPVRRKQRCVLCDFTSRHRGSMINHLCEVHSGAIKGCMGAAGESQDTGTSKADAMLTSKKNLGTSSGIKTAENKNEIGNIADAETHGLTKKNENMGPEKNAKSTNTFPAADTSKPSGSIVSDSVGDRYKVVESEYRIERSDEYQKLFRSIVIKNGTYKCRYCKEIQPGRYRSKHLNTHIREKSYCCNHCDFQTKNYNSVQQHILLKHRHQLRNYTNYYTKKPYRGCQTAEVKAMFDAEMGLYICSHCKAKLKTQSTCEQHLLQHTNEKPYQCKLCHFESRQGVSMKLHFAKHHIDDIEKIEGNNDENEQNQESLLLPDMNKAQVDMDIGADRGICPSSEGSNEMRGRGDDEENGLSLGEDTCKEKNHRATIRESTRTQPKPNKSHSIEVPKQHRDSTDTQPKLTNESCPIEVPKQHRDRTRTQPKPTNESRPIEVPKQHTDRTRTKPKPTNESRPIEVPKQHRDSTHTQPKPTNESRPMEVPKQHSGSNRTNLESYLLEVLKKRRESIRTESKPANESHPIEVPKQQREGNCTQPTPPHENGSPQKPNNQGEGNCTQPKPTNERHLTKVTKNQRDDPRTQPKSTNENHPTEVRHILPHVSTVIDKMQRRGDSLMRLVSVQVQKGQTRKSKSTHRHPLFKKRAQHRRDAAKCSKTTDGECKKLYIISTTPRFKFKPNQGSIEGYFYCCYCAMQFEDSKQVEEHSDQHIGEQIYECIVCDYTSPDQSCIGIHVELCHRDTLKNKSQIERHQHGSEAVEDSALLSKTIVTVPTEYCFLIVKTDRDKKYRPKRNTETGCFVCSFCSLESHSYCHVEEHTRTHTGEKVYHCLVCEFRFCQQTEMKAHVTSHFQNLSGKNWCGKKQSLTGNSVCYSARKSQAANIHSSDADGTLQDMETDEEKLVIDEDTNKIVVEEDKNSESSSGSNVDRSIWQCNWLANETSEQQGDACIDEISRIQVQKLDMDSVDKLGKSHGATMAEQQGIFQRIQVASPQSDRSTSSKHVIKQEISDSDNAHKYGQTIGVNIGSSVSSDTCLSPKIQTKDNRRSSNEQSPTISVFKDEPNWPDEVNHGSLSPVSKAKLVSSADIKTKSKLVPGDESLREGVIFRCTQSPEPMPCLKKSDFIHKPGSIHEQAGSENDKSGLFQGVQSKDQYSFRCVLCNGVFLTYKSALSHIMVAHPERKYPDVAFSGIYISYEMHGCDKRRSNLLKEKQNFKFSNAAPDSHGEVTRSSWKNQKGAHKRKHTGSDVQQDLKITAHINRKNKRFKFKSSPSGGHYSDSLLHRKLRKPTNKSPEKAKFSFKRKCSANSNPGQSKENQSVCKTPIAKNIASRIGAVQVRLSSQMQSAESRINKQCDNGYKLVGSKHESARSKSNFTFNPIRLEQHLSMTDGKKTRSKSNFDFGVSKYESSTDTESTSHATHDRAGLLLLPGSVKRNQCDTMDLQELSKDRLKKDPDASMSESKTKETLVHEISEKLPIGSKSYSSAMIGDLLLQTIKKEEVERESDSLYEHTESSLPETPCSTEEMFHPTPMVTSAKTTKRLGDISPKKLHIKCSEPTAETSSQIQLNNKDIGFETPVAMSAQNIQRCDETSKELPQSSTDLAVTPKIHGGHELPSSLLTPPPSADFRNRYRNTVKTGHEKSVSATSPMEIGWCAQWLVKDGRIYEAGTTDSMKTEHDTSISATSPVEIGHWLVKGGKIYEAGTTDSMAMCTGVKPLVIDVDSEHSSSDDGVLVIDCPETR